MHAQASKQLSRKVKYHTINNNSNVVCDVVFESSENEMVSPGPIVIWFVIN